MKPTTVLVILDGWGHRESSDDNALTQAKTPTWDALWREYPHSLLHCSGKHVGLPEGQMGNSEVGHTTIGAGRIVNQDLDRIDHAIETDRFVQQPAIDALLTPNQSGTLHVFGLLSPGGVHSHENHILHLLERAISTGRQVVLHAILDGRDTAPKSAYSSLNRLTALASHPNFQLATIAGRFYAMDRDERWERTKLAYDLYVDGTGKFKAQTGLEGLYAAYQRGESDEFVVPTAIGRSRLINDGDDLLFMNFRADRALQLCRAFLREAKEQLFPRTRRILNHFVTLTPYATDISCESYYTATTSVAFETEEVQGTFAQIVSQAGKSQLRIAETEKFAHVTYFFSCGSEQLQPSEHRHIIPSPKVATYDLQPEMSAYAITDYVVDSIKEGNFDTIICNFANADMVGHTGEFDAAVKAVECIDQCLARITDAVIKTNSNCVITADHGNVEQMQDLKSEQAHTAHTVNPVPLLYIGNRKVGLAPEGGLQDVAPTLLELMEIYQPAVMTGRSLLR